ncbi:hypothetical protein [Jeotgalibacillus proteolyticus]|uniref:Uncharacterized protein n=1 Tax=Jeotgalibacillus proteolyticus TaxID=2082395 RepID=A0A2S5G9J3_9BACL|nr:hypothetical protein [Jeotgalibacillus proteolyticus]PPA69670.1 hypothetical protein C4B60_14095 [Jeotgalibacillus proteolyticus]
MLTKRRAMIIRIVIFFAIFYALNAVIETRATSFKTPAEALSLEFPEQTAYSLIYNKDRTLAVAVTGDKLVTLREGLFGWKTTFSAEDIDSSMMVIDDGGDQKTLLGKIDKTVSQVQVDDQKTEMISTKDGAFYWLLFNPSEEILETESLNVSYLNKKGEKTKETVFNGIE